MLNIHPFAAFRPIPAKSGEISCEPGERLSLTECMRRVGAFPKTWLQVIREDVCQSIGRPEAGVKLFESLKQENFIRQDAQPHMYAYRQVRAGKKSVALIATLELSNEAAQQMLQFQMCSADDVRRVRERDQLLAAQAEIVVVGYHQHSELSDFILTDTNERPLAHFVGKDGATHSVWCCKDAARAAELVAQLESVVVFSGGEVLDVMRLGVSSRRLVTVAFFPIEQCTIRCAHILVNTGNAQELLKHLNTFHDSTAFESPENPGEPPSGFFDAYMRDPTAAHQEKASWLRRRIPPSKPGLSDADNAQRARFVKAVMDPWMQENSEPKPSHCNWSAAISVAHAANEVDSANALALFVFAPPSMLDALEIGKSGGCFEHGTITCDPVVPSGLFIQSIV